MSINITLAWKSGEYQAGLSEEQQALVPVNPVGLIELTDDELEAATGAAETATGTGSGTCVCSSTGTGSGQSCQCSCGGA